MASKYSPEAQGSPFLVTTIATAGVLLLLEAIHRLPEIIATLRLGVHSAAALVAVLFAVMLLLALESTTAVSKHRNNGIQK